MREKYLVVGFREVNFKAEDGKQINGYSVYYTQESDDPSIIGQITGKSFINTDKVDYIPEIGQYISFVYNRYGKICAVDIV